MKKIVFVFLFCYVFTVSVFSQNIKPTFKLDKTETYTAKNSFIIFNGSVATSPVTMFLNDIPAKDGNINGKYYYDKVKKDIALSGEIKKGVITLKETIDGKATGFFSGTINKNNVFEGVWRSVDGKKEFNFNFQKSKTENNDVSFKVNFYYVGYEENYSYIDEDGDERNTSFSDVSILALIDNANKNPVIEKININLNSLKTKTATVKDLENYAINNIKNFYNEWSNEGEKEYPYSQEVSVNVDYFDGKVINFRSSYEGYYGGAHGSYNYIYQIYLLETGENISSATNLIKNINDKNLINLLREKLLNTENQMTEDDYFDFEDIRLNDNFFITENGIIFYYTQYEIAAYVYGPQEVFFTFEELKPYIKTGSPFSYLFN